jgi:outer membrane protein OmpA-like peptidoglycan-associated protein
MSVVVAGAQSAEVSNLGSFSARVSEHDHALARVAEAEAQLNLQSISVLYEHNKAWPCWSYKNNIAAYRKLVAMIKQIASKKAGSHTIIIEGSASPIGSDKYNHALALRRANVLRNIIAKMEGGDKLTIHTTSAGEGWKAFESYVESSYQAENRREVLAILRMNASNAQKEHYIYALDAGKTWKVLTTKFMGSARNATVVRIVENEALLNDSIRWAVKPAELITPFSIERKTKPIEIRKPVVAVRSNLLVPALNVGVEAPIGTHWSVGADYYFPWIWTK